MKTTQELYGIDPHILADLPYREAIERKILACTDRIAHLAKEGKKFKWHSLEYNINSLNYADTVKAKAFNIQLLEELDA